MITLHKGDIDDDDDNNNNNNNNNSNNNNNNNKLFNLQSPCVLFIGQTFRYSLEKAFYIFNEQIYFI